MRWTLYEHIFKSAFLDKTSLHFKIEAQSILI